MRNTNLRQRTMELMQKILDSAGQSLTFTSEEKEIMSNPDTYTAKKFFWQYTHSTKSQEDPTSRLTMMWELYDSYCSPTPFKTEDCVQMSLF